MYLLASLINRYVIIILNLYDDDHNIIMINKFKIVYFRTTLDTRYSFVCIMHSIFISTIYFIFYNIHRQQVRINDLVLNVPERLSSVDRLTPVHHYTVYAYQEVLTYNKYHLCTVHKVIHNYISATFTIPSLQTAALTCIVAVLVCTYYDHSNNKLISHKCQGQPLQAPLPWVGGVFEGCSGVANSEHKPLTTDCPRQILRGVPLYLWTDILFSVVNNTVNLIVQDNVGRYGHNTDLAAIKHPKAIIQHKLFSLF